MIDPDDFLCECSDSFVYPEPECKPVTIRDALMGPPYDMDSHMADPCPNCGGYRMALGDWVCWDMCFICAKEKGILDY